jgi:predicted SPOUT superfamily RNA methylase MTH1
MRAASIAAAEPASPSPTTRMSVRISPPHLLGRSARFRGPREVEDFVGYSVGWGDSITNLSKSNSRKESRGACPAEGRVGFADASMRGNQQVPSHISTIL